jgi:uncharacterized phage-like protein YoqJ
MIISFTGSRPPKIGGYKLPNPTYIHVCQQLDKILKELKPEKCISGMALGFDSYAANVCIKLEIPFVAAIPFIGQEKAWPESSQKTYQKLLSKASEKVIVSEGGYSAEKMQLRNQWMCDHADIVIACWDKTPGGTKNCIDYAKSINKEIIYINPTPPKSIEYEQEEFALTTVINS